MSPDKPEHRPEDDLAERDRAAAADDRTAIARDVAAESDDQDANARDRAADERDVDAESRDQQAAAEKARTDREQAAEDRHRAAEDRARARRDRTTSQQQRRRAGEDRGAAHDAVAELRGLLFRAEDDTEAMIMIGQAQGMVMAAKGASPLEALLEISTRAARDLSELESAARSIVSEATD